MLNLPVSARSFANTSVGCCVLWKTDVSVSKGKLITMAELTASESRNRKGRNSRIKNLRSTRVDLTPMVDLGFLLITFFVFTTSLSEAKAMDLIETHDGPPIKIKKSAVMTLIPTPDHKILYYYADLNANNQDTQVMKTDFNAIRSIIVDFKRKTDQDYLMYLIKADKKSTYGDIINLLDEMSICGIKSGHFTEVEITEEESDILKSKN